MRNLSVILSLVSSILSDIPSTNRQCGTRQFSSDLCNNPRPVYSELVNDGRRWPCPRRAPVLTSFYGPSLVQLWLTPQSPTSPPVLVKKSDWPRKVYFKSPAESRSVP